MEVKRLAGPGLESSENLSSNRRVRPSGKVPAGAYGSKWQKEAERPEPATLASAGVGLVSHQANGACGRKGRATRWGASLGGLESSGTAPTPAFLAVALLARKGLLPRLL